MSAPLLAAAAAALGPLALWELLAALEAHALAPALRRLVAPLVRAQREGREPSTPERRRLAVTATGALLAGGWLLAGPLLGVTLAAAGPWALGALLRRRRRRYREELERAAPAVARAIADAIGAGHAVPGALAEAAGGFDPAHPAAIELGALADALALGEPLEDALARLCERARSRAYDTLVAAILLQRDAGGDLATLLRDLAAAQEAAARSVADARAATAQARFTGLLVALLPAGAAVLVELASPGALAGVLRAPLAAWLAGFAALLQLAGFVAIRRIARVVA
jgi:tight adherence protein B